MSQSRIDELHPRELDQLQDDFNTGQLGMADVGRLFAHITTLTRQRDELKAACEEVVKELENGLGLELFVGGICTIKYVSASLQSALAATASGKGE